MPILPINHIDTKPESGVPRIAGTRFTIPIIVATLRNNPDMTPESYAEEFGLTLGQVYAALSYYHDHKAEIEALFQQWTAESEAGIAETAAFNERLRERMQQLHNQPD